jgi:hypothetical protein
MNAAIGTHMRPSGIRGEAGCGHDVECVVVEPAIGDHEVLGLGDGRATHVPEQLTSALRHVQFHPDQQIGFAAGGLRHRAHSRYSTTPALDFSPRWWFTPPRPPAAPV